MTPRFTYAMGQASKTPSPGSTFVAGSWFGTLAGADTGYRAVVARMRFSPPVNVEARRSRRENDRS